VRMLRALRPNLLDRYVVAEILPPTAVGLLIFTFILLLQQITLLTGILIARGADLATILHLFFNLIPHILATTIPMAFLLGVLLAFGRMAADSELVALRASGVSPLQLLRPVLGVACVMTAITYYVLAYSVPRANQTYRETFYALVVARARTAVKPRVFAEDLIPNMVLYVSDVPADTKRWKDLLISDMTFPRKPRLIVARRGRLVIDEARQRVEMHPEAAAIHPHDALRPQEYEVQAFKTAELPLPFEQLFPRLPVTKGDREMTPQELLAKIASLRQEGHPDEALRYLVEYWKKLAIPAACLVFGVLGLGLSLGSRKEARSAAFGLSVSIIFIYYVFLRLGEQAGDTGTVPPFVSMWAANVVLGLAAAILLLLNHREAAFDPLDASHYRIWLPAIRRGQRPRPVRRPPPGRPVVVLRVPRVGLGIPGLLDRYIAREYLGYFMLVLTSFLAIFVLVEFMDLMDDIDQHDIQARTIFRYYLFHTPFIVHLIAPVAVLVTTLVTFGVMSRRNEITAMKAGGVSVFRASLPALAMGVLGSLTLFVLSEWVLPETNKLANRDYNVIKGRPPQSASYLESRWILGSDGRFYHYDYMAEEGPDQILLHGLSVYDIDPTTWRLTDRLTAGRAEWNGVAYDLQQGWRRTFGERPSFRSFAAVKTREIEPPDYFRRETREPDTLGFAGLRKHIAQIEALGLDVSRLRVQLHKKLAFPMLGLVMTLIGIPFAFVVGRRGALHGIAISIVVAIVYWACLGIFEALGNNALLPPPLAAWTPNILFSAAGLYLLLTIET
jgi:LPS export ABC transporter permease LptG/LPS export ABC transporter permease LptF